MIGLNLYFGSRGVSPEPFPAFGPDFITDYDRSVNTHRLHARDALRNDLDIFVKRCEAHGYSLLGFQFAIDREKMGFGDAVAAEIGCQDFAFFANSDERTWRGNEDRKIDIPDGAAIVQAANQYVFVEEVAKVLQNIRSDLEWKSVATVDKLRRCFLRIVTRPEYSFLSPATVVGDQWTMLWVAGSAEPPEDLFFDRIGIGLDGGFHPLIVSRGTAAELKRKFPRFPLIPVLPCNSDTSKAVVRVCDFLRPRIKSAANPQA